MQYRAFDSYHVGFSHTKNEKVCEDFSISYSDPSGRYFIASACDGHSDNNCFRSAQGARFGCEAAKEVLCRFFDTYLEENMTVSDLSDNDVKSLKKSLKQCWANKVIDDIEQDPVREEEMEPLSDSVRDYYKAGKGLQNIYGATYLAVAICNDLFIAMHIGDGVMIAVSEDGTYYEPLEQDEKGEMGEPASLCNDDLFSRERAFRCTFSDQLPVAVVVSSDGIGDSLDHLQFKEVTHSILKKLYEMEGEEQDKDKLSEEQQQYIDSFVEYWAEADHGVDDDCSYAGIYLYDEEIPEVKIPLDSALDMLDDAVSERNLVIQDYEKRKRELTENIERAERDAMTRIRKGSLSTDLFLEAKGNIEDMKRILRNIDQNENEKSRYYDERINACTEYVVRAGGMAELYDLCPISELNPDLLAEDEAYFEVMKAKEEFEKKKKRLEEDARKDCEQDGPLVPEQTEAEQPEPEQPETEQVHEETADEVQKAERDLNKDIHALIFKDFKAFISKDRFKKQND